MFSLKKTAISICLVLLVAATAHAQIPQIVSANAPELLSGPGRIPTIAVDSRDIPHIMADGGISKAGVNVYDKMSNGTWVNSSFDSYNEFGSTQFFNPHLEIDASGKAFCGGIVFGQIIGMGSVLRTGMNTDSPSDPKAGYSVRRIQGPWDAGESSIDLSTPDQFILSSSFGRARIYTYDPSAYGLITEIEYRQMFAGNGGEKNAFWVSKTPAQVHPVSGTHAIWHGAIGGYASMDSSYQNSIRHENGLGPVAWAAFWRYPIMGDDGTYIDVKSDNVDPQRAYLSCDFKGDGGVVVNIFDPDTGEMIFPIADCLSVDAAGGSGLRRFAPQLAPAKDGGAWICWTSRGGVYVRYISPEGVMGDEYRVDDGYFGNLCVDSTGDIHVAYSNGNMRYRKLTVQKTPDAVLRPVDIDGDGEDDILMFDPSTATFRVYASTDGQYSFQYGESGDVAVPADYDGSTPEANFAVFRPSTGQWFIRPDGGGSAAVYTLGSDEDIPVPADYDGDGNADVAVVDPESYVWLIKRSSDGVVTTNQHGIAKDVPVPGDYDTDGQDNIAVFRPSDFTWYVGTSTGLVTQGWGWTGDIPAPADYDGDGVDDYAIYRPAESMWYIKPSAGGPRIEIAWGGGAGDKPVPGDYDADGTNDCAVFRESTGTWHIRQSSTGTIKSGPPVYYGWAAALDTPVPGPYQSTNGANIAVYRPLTSTWYIRNLTDGNPSIVVPWGDPTDTPVPADYDGDGYMDPAVVSPVNGATGRFWQIDPSGGGSDILQPFGWTGDIPIPGDYDKDGAADIAMFRPSTLTGGEAMWFIKGSSSGRVDRAFGWFGDTPIPADYDGDGETDIAVFRSSEITGGEARWFISQSQDGNISKGYGWFGDLPVPSDYDGDGKTDIAIFRPSTATWFIRSSITGSTTSAVWGVANDLPVPADYDLDGKADMATYGEGTWHIRQSSDGNEMIGRGPITWGLPGEIAIGTRDTPLY